MLEQDRYDLMIQNDQLNIEKQIKRIAHGYNEGPINFAPTYKHSANSDNYNPKRSPAWTDRVLFRSNERIL